MLRLYILLTLLFVGVDSISAKEIDLSSATSAEIYSAKIGGTPHEGVLERLSVTLPEYKNAVLIYTPRRAFDGTNQTHPLYTTDITRVVNQQMKSAQVGSTPIFFVALELLDGRYMTLQPISTQSAMNWIEVRGKNQVDIVCGTMGSAPIDSAELPMFSYSVSDDFYEALAISWSDIIKNKEVKGCTTWRDQKSYPEPFKYLGWCSWEQYKLNINEPLLLSAIDNIEESNIPIRWVLVDDGHQDEEIVGCEDGKVLAKHRFLMSLDLSAEKFPNGWSYILAKRSDKVRWFGLWHCMYGMWAGVSPRHTMGDLSNYLIDNSEGGLIVSEDPEGSELFYNKLIKTAYEPGFDFVKIDVQSSDLRYYIDAKVGNPVKAHTQNAQNLEREVNDNLLGMMNCMAQTLPSIFNTRHSATTRVSVDYQLNNIPKASSHIYQGFQNTVWMGQTVWPDHDMFHSSDIKLGRFMAVSKAMSGAPVYLSDAPKDFVSEYITPLIYDDGELLRPLAPGSPLPSSFFANALTGDEAYGVIAPLTEKSAAVVIYNVSVNPEVSTIRGEVTESDYRFADAMMQPYGGVRELPSEGLAYYDWYTKQGGKLDGAYSFDLDKASDRLVILSEIENGWSVLGNPDKYLSTVVVESYRCTKQQITINLHEKGRVLIYSDKQIKSIKGGEILSSDTGLYEIQCCDSRVVVSR